MPERRYTDAEVREILRRSTRVERRPALPGPGTQDGLTLRELEDVAREAGIDPVAVRHAALARLPSPSPSLADLLRGGPSLREQRVQLPGRLPPERHRDLAEALDRTFRADGALDRPEPRDSRGQDRGLNTRSEPAGGDASLSRPFRWAEDHTQGRTRVAVASDPEGGSVVTVRADRRGWAAALNLVGLAAGVGVGGLAILPATGSALGAVAGSVAVWWGVVHLVWRGRARRIAEQMETAVAAVVARLLEDDP